MRKTKPQLQRIDIDELFTNSSNRGMLSFLERPPDEAKTRLVEKQRVNYADAQRVTATGELPPVVTHSVQDLPPGASYRLMAETAELHPDGMSPTGSPALTLSVSYPEGELHTQPAALIDGSIIGRRQKIRRALAAQDGHSSGEHMLYQSLWNAARVETSETRLISIGYNGMSALCRLDKSNCKKNIQSLLEKLSVQVAETYQSVSSTGTTYRIFSQSEILRRREVAGMVWVIRTSGVRFVYPEGELPIAPVGKTPRAS